MSKTIKKKNNKNIKKIFIIIIFLFIIIIIGSRIKNTNKNSETYSVIINNQEIALQNDIIMQNDVIYMSLDDIKNSIDKNIYVENSDTIITSGDKKVIKLQIDNSDVQINGAKVTIDGQAFKTENNVIYIPISELENVYDIDFQYIENTKNIIIDYYSDKLEKAYVKKNVNVKSEAKTFGKKLEKIKKGNWVIFVSEENGWAKVRTQDGILGFIKKKYLTNFVTERDDFNIELSNDISEYLESDIIKKDLSTYENRINVIEDVMQKAVLKKYKKVKFIYNNDEQNEGYDRFKIEAVPVFKECGISVEF